MRTPDVDRLAETVLPTPHGLFRALAYRERSTAREHLALVLGNLAHVPGPLVRVHSECLTGDVIASLRCDCGPQLDASLRAIAAEGTGVLIYVRGHEGRGIGLVDKLRAYSLQDHGADTVDANLLLGLPADARDYTAAAAILNDLSLPTIRLLTNNPAKVTGLISCGIAIQDVVPVRTAPNPANIRYLRTKSQRWGHDLGPSVTPGA